MRISDWSSDVCSSDLAFGGYQFNQWFGLEAGYADLGELEPGVAGQSLEASSAYFTAVGTLPFTDTFSGYAQAGFQRWDLDTSIPGLAGTAIGRAHVSTPVTNAHLVSRLLLEKKTHENPK